MTTTELVEAIKHAWKVVTVLNDGTTIHHDTHKELAHWLWKSLTGGHLSVIERDNSLIILQHPTRKDSNISVADGEEWVDTTDLATGPMAHGGTMTDRQAASILSLEKPHVTTITYNRTALVERQVDTMSGRSEVIRKFQVTEQTKSPDQRLLSEIKLIKLVRVTTTLEEIA